MSAQTRHSRLTRCLALALALVATPAIAGDYTVSPMRMELNRDTRSSVVTLGNAGEDRIDFQVKAMEWTQDAEGADRYTETDEVVFFPKVLSVEPGEQRVVRVGVKTLPVVTERTFRLFIEKLPAPVHEPLPPGSRVTVNVRFAMPVFVKPATPGGPKAEVVGTALTRGELVFAVKNAGNEHLRMDEGIALSGRNAQGAEVFTQKIEQRYVLAGMTKRLAATIPKTMCEQLASIEITARSEQVMLNSKLDVDRTSCN